MKKYDASMAVYVILWLMLVGSAASYIWSMYTEMKVLKENLPSVSAGLFVIGTAGLISWFVKNKNN